MTNNLLLRQKYHQYKMYTPAGVYLGLLQGVVSPFQNNQNIATAFTQLSITVQQSADVAGQAVTPLQDEQGNSITDEQGNNILIERQPDIVGSSNSNALIANNNLVQVYEYSNYYPNGLLVFSGYVSKWKTTFGSTNDIVITAISNGQDLNNYLVSTGDTALISQTTDDGSVSQIGITDSKAGSEQRYAQSFTVASTVTLGGVSIELLTPEAGTLTISVYQMVGSTPSLGSDPLIATGSLHLGIIAKSAQKVSFTNSSVVSAGNTYYFVASWRTDSGNVNLATSYATVANPYANGIEYLMQYPGFGGSWTPTAAPSYDMYFIIWQHGGNVTGAYTSQDPSFMLGDIITNYISGGGLIGEPVAQTPLYSMPLTDTIQPTAYWSAAYAQTVTPTAATTMNVVQLYLGVTSGSTVVSVQLCQGDPSLDNLTVTGGLGTYTFGAGNFVIDTSNSLTIINTTAAITTFQFPSYHTLAKNQQYYFLIQFAQGQEGNLVIKGAGSGDLPITNAGIGKEYKQLVLVNNSGGNLTYDSSYPAMYINLFNTSLPVPSNLNGGYQNTGTVTSYTFKMQTILQAIQAIVALAPANWYWYVDPATNILNFAQANTTADVTIIRGRHIDELDIEATKENVKNTAYFTGGDDGTGTSTNILVKQSLALGSNRAGLVLLADNRVNSTSGGTTTAKLIALNYLNNNSAETYITNVTIQDQTMDTNLFKLGYMVGFEGFGNFVDKLLLQIVGINRSPDQVVLQLGTLPIRASQEVAQISAALTNQQTVANPTTPS